MTTPRNGKAGEAESNPEPHGLGLGGAPGSRFYVVTGYALVPHKVEMWVEAETPRQAMQKAKRTFDRGPHRANWLVAGSEDTTAAFDFEPSEAMPPINGSNGALSNGGQADE